MAKIITAKPKKVPRLDHIYVDLKTKKVAMETICLRLPVEWIDALKQAKADFAVKDTLVTTSDLIREAIYRMWVDK